MSANSGNPVVTTPQIMSAGLAATGASFVTSKFGVAGTLLGAALTAMLVTGGAAILRAYLETLSGHVRGVPKKLRSRREQQGDATMPGRPYLRDNSVGRMRAALGWFSNLPTLRRRSILMKGLLAAGVAFLLCMGLVWSAEKAIGNSLSCGLWAACPYGATPGVHPMGYGGTGAGSSLSGGAMDTGGAGQSPLDRVRQNGNPFSAVTIRSSETQAAGPPHRSLPNPPPRRSLEQTDRPHPRPDRESRARTAEAPPRPRRASRRRPPPPAPHRKPASKPPLPAPLPLQASNAPIILR